MCGWGSQLDVVPSSVIAARVRVVALKINNNGRRHREGEKVHLLKVISVTADTSQLPITPYGLPVASFEAAKIGQDPSLVSPKHPPVQAHVG